MMPGMGVPDPRMLGKDIQEKIWSNLLLFLFF